MTGDLVPAPPTRVSDAERALVVERLTGAVGEGRLTLADFDERIGGVLAAVTVAELERYTADLPAACGAPALHLRARASSLRRAGRWVVPRQVIIEVSASSVRLDLTQAVIAAPEVDVALDVRTGSVHLVLPPGASATADDVELTASTIKSTVPPGGGPHLRLHGRLRSSSVRVRYQRRFLRWRW